jgi:hypothetical protein
MDTFIVYLDDADFAKQQLTPLLSSDAPAHWVLVACAPRMSRRIGKWLSHSARENWRAKWADNVFAQIVPLLQRRGDRVEHMVAGMPLPDLTQRLRGQLHNARIVDTRRPKFGQMMEPVCKDQAREKQGWQIPAAVGSLSAVLVLAAE